MNKKAVALFSGGLDSALAVCAVKEQGIEVEAINFQTMFGCCKDDARAMAFKLGIGYTTLKVGDDYLSMVKKPKYGYGRGINPCVDCRAYMFDLGKKYMHKVGASFLISGEVLGQRPMSQKRRDFGKIEKETGMAGYIVRPLSAKLLDATEPEKQGILDRSKLYGIQGRSRSELVKLAEKYGIENPPEPSVGCALTQVSFAKKVRDVFDHAPDWKRWEFEILRIGRHFRFDAETKIIVSRNEEENDYLKALHPQGTIFCEPLNFKGPNALIIGEDTEQKRSRTGSIMLRYGRMPDDGSAAEIEFVKEGERAVLLATLPAAEEEVDGVRIV